MVCVGQIVNVHGIKGMVKVRPYLSNPMDIGSLGVLTDNDGRHFDIKAVSRKGDFVFATVKGVQDRTQAEALKGVSLYVDREQLPQQKSGEFYYCDLIGMRVLENGQLYGTVEAVQNFGAGDILDVKTKQGRVFSFDFSKATFPRVDVISREMDIILPVGMTEVAHES
jgi:16S rRNA processing protein RimM